MDLEKAYKLSAKIVELFGDQYLPLFLRLHGEMQKVSSQLDKKNLALEVAKAYNQEMSHTLSHKMTTAVNNTCSETST